jgi:Asp-tRNA(Asn)/Glu-tRNA(Gln) amidotransferase B subunit
VATVAVAWFRREDYERIREISDDEMQPTFIEYETKMAELLARFAARSIAYEKVIIDPDELVTFAKSINAGKIDTKVRSQLAAAILMKKKSTH